MKKLVFLIPAVVSLTFAGVVRAQEATPSPSPLPTSTPAETPVATPATPSPVTPAPASTINLPASLSLTPEAAPSDADLLPPVPGESGAATEPLPPSDESLPPPDDTLPPTDEPGTADLPDPDTLIPPEDTESEPPPAPVIVENKFKEDRDLKVRYQEVKLQALKDAKVRSLREQSEAAKTDEAKRQALREYYRLLFGKMVSIDANLKPKCDLMEKAYLRRLGQYRVEPTIPLAPPPVPEPLEMAVAAPTPKPKRGN